MISPDSGTRTSVASGARLERFSSMTILVVDDNEANVTLLSTLLKRHGIQNVATETDSRRVAGLLTELKPDLVLLDLHMPFLDGVAVSLEVKQFAAGSYLPVLILTADVTTTARNEALEHGAADFLTKPLDHVEVVLRVANLLETRRLYSMLRSARSEDDPEPADSAPDLQPHRIHKVLSSRGIVPHFQPVVDVHNGRIVGHEALARFHDPHPQGIAGWFTEAFAVGLGTDLEWLAVSESMPFLAAAPPDTFLALNMSPATVGLLEQRHLCEPALSSRVVIELTEHVPIEDYSAIRRALAPLRSDGARLAADDLGSGYAGFRHLIALAPDIIKLDMSLVRGIHRNRPQRALARALVAFAADVGATVVAEGVEEAAELEVLVDLEVPWAQGYLLGRPESSERSLANARTRAASQAVNTG